MIHISIDTDNAAFDDDYRGEVKRILSKVTGDSGQKIRDINGNFVATVSHTTEAKQDIWEMLFKLEQMCSNKEITRETKEKFNRYFDKYMID